MTECGTPTDESRMTSTNSNSGNFFDSLRGIKVPSKFKRSRNSSRDQASQSKDMTPVDNATHENANQETMPSPWAEFRVASSPCRRQTHSLKHIHQAQRDTSREAEQDQMAADSTSDVSSISSSSSNDTTLSLENISLYSDTTFDSEILTSPSFPDRNNTRIEDLHHKLPRWRAYANRMAQRMDMLHEELARVSAKYRGAAWKSGRVSKYVKKLEKELVVRCSLKKKGSDGFEWAREDGMSNCLGELATRRRNAFELEREAAY